MIDYKWIDEILDNCSLDGETKKNIFDIAGYPHYENVISNLYAFYFNPLEEHNFKDLFISSLIELFDENSSWITMDFSELLVEREFPTDKGGRIDLVLHDSTENGLASYNDGEEIKESETGWAIIIENKIHHTLENDLDDYWNSVQSDNKVGIVLTLFPLKTNNNNFVNITHNQLIAKVKSNLPDYFIEANDRHLSILKDFIMNLENQTMNDNSQNLDNNFFAYQSAFEKIKELEKAKKEIYININRIIKKAFKNTYFAHSPQGENAHNGRHFNGFTHNKYKAFRLWVNFDVLFSSKNLIINFELFDKTYTKFRSILRDQLKASKNFKFSNGGKDGGGYAHVYRTEILFNEEELNSISTSIPQKIGERLFLNTLDTDGKHILVDILEKAVAEFEKLK